MDTLKAIILGAAGGAVIAGVFSLVNLLISKDQKVSEYRQQWIDSLRQDIAGFLSEIETISRFAEAELDARDIDRFSPDEIKIFRSTYKDHYLKLNVLHRLVLLRLNHGEREHKILIDNITKIYNAFYGDCYKIKEVYGIINDITQNSQDIIKEAWEKVKSGETFYQITKIALSIILGLVSTVGFVKFVQFIFS